MRTIDGDNGDKVYSVVLLCDHSSLDVPHCEGTAEDQGLMVCDGRRPFVGDLRT